MSSLPAASTWETQCFVSAAVFGACVIAVVSSSIARRARVASPLRRILLTVLITVVFVAMLALVFASVDPCAQGPA